MSWVLAFVGFAMLIVLHEAGHFAAAKAVGMHVTRFSLFFGPMIVKFRRGETEYGIGVIPLGGYVKISGMTTLDAMPDEIVDRAYYNQAPWKRIVVILAGPVVNIVIAFLIFFCLLTLKGPYVEKPVVDQITKNSAAAQVLRPGDRIVAVDGLRGTPAELRRQITTHRCQGAQRNGCLSATPVRITLVRGGKTTTVSAHPRYTTDDGGGARPVLGFAFGSVNKPENVVAGARDSVDTMWSVTTATVSAIGRIFVSSKARKQVSGVVGTYEVTRQTIQKEGWEDALQILALVSLSLGIVNLFPFLPLDGGHIFWAVAEKVRGRRISLAVMEKAGVIGFMLVIALFAIGLANDVGRLDGAGFGIR